MITALALPVITGPVCNENRALQPVITDETDLQALQITPVITGNGEPVIDSLDMSDPETSVSVLANRYRESMYLSTTNDGDGFDEEVTHPVRRRYPVVCPSCGSSRIQPTFLSDDEWDCAELNCLAVWTEGGR